MKPLEKLTGSISMIKKVISLLLFPSCVFSASFFNEHEQGWFWYQDPKQAKKEVESLNPAIASEQMNALRKEVEDSANLAILYPSEENLISYAKNYHKVINQGQRFTDSYKLMLLKNPEFDYSLKFPLNPISHRVYDRKKERSIETVVGRFAKEYGFFFFFSSKCQFCHVFSPTIKAFSEKYQTPVIAISMDGGSLPEFPNPQKDNQASIRFRVTALPALFAVNPKTGQALPVANSAISLHEIEENIFKMVSHD